jgi:phosphoenolpyruvate phosphomutase
MKHDPAIDRRTRLRRLIEQPGLSFLLEAHNALSARIAWEAGFEALWGSGLAISASMGLPDNNEATFTEVLDVVEKICDAVPVPLLLDADTGYGDHNNVQRLVRLAERRGVAGICMEDKVFPKRNSLLEQQHHELEDPDVFAGKIMAAKDTARHSDFVVVARLEALVVGAGQEIALARAERYREAGATAIVVHSKKSEPSEVLEFARAWRHETPLICIPTRYHTTPASVFEEYGLRACIWANHLLRASIQTMQETARSIHRERSVSHVDSAIASVEEVFRLQDQQRVNAAELQYGRVRSAKT